MFNSKYVRQITVYLRSKKNLFATLVSLYYHKDTSGALPQMSVSMEMF